ncbi:hypothetical protein MC885_021073 [Smutsia gigantea]|nr:hypothetical protein MC885_021073 [Smutsia gigantea]
MMGGRGYFSREKPLRRRYLKRWGKEGAAGAAAETVGATGGPAAAAGTAAGGAGQRLPRPGPGSSRRRLGSRSRRFSTGRGRLKWEPRLEKAGGARPGGRAAGERDPGGAARFRAQRRPRTELGAR